jgi:hypothetical protein
MKGMEKKGDDPLIDRDKVLAGLATMKVYFEHIAEAETRAADRKRLMLHWANVCIDAAELIESMETEGDDGK